jgi:transposase
VLIGDSTSLVLPDELASEFPGCGGLNRSGLAVLKIQLLWELITGAILRFDLEPGKNSDVKSPIAAASAPPGSLSVFDLGYFSLERFRQLSNNKAYWISRLQYGTNVLDENGQPLSLLEFLRSRHSGSKPVDVMVLLGERERLPARLIAIRAPEEVANSRRRTARRKAQKDGRTSSREYLEWQDWTIFVTNCEPEKLAWKEIVVLYRARWQIELLFKLWKSHNGIAVLKVGATAVERMAIIFAKLIVVILQHWILLKATWSNGRRSLRKAADHLRDWVKQLIETLDDIERLTAVLDRIEQVLGRLATVRTRTGRPSHAQFMINPELLDWAP